MNGRECEDLPNGHILKAQLTPLHSPPTTASLFKEPRKIQIQIRLRLQAQIKLQTQMFIAKTNDTLADLLLHSQRKFSREKQEYCSRLLIKGTAHTSYLSILVHHPITKAL